MFLFSCAPLLILVESLRLHEEGRIDNLFKRDGCATVQTFKSLAHVCNIPLCAQRAFFLAVMQYLTTRKLKEEQRKNGKRSLTVDNIEELRGGIISKVTLAEFKHFWRSELYGYDDDARLFNILRYPNERVVRVQAIEAIISDFILDRYYKRRNTNALPDHRIYAEIGTAVIAFSLHAGRTTFSLSELQRMGLFKKLLSVESGLNKGVLSGLKLESLEKVRREFAIGRGSGQRVPEPMTVEDLTVYNNKKNLLTPICVHLIFGRYCNRRGMTLFHFTQFLLAVGDPYDRHAAEYLLPLVDSDLNGRITVDDALTMYKEKARILRERKVEPMSFEIYWNQLCDQAIAVSEGHDQGALAGKEVILRSPRVRASVIDTLLTRNDALAVVDSSGASARAMLQTSLVTNNPRI